MNVFDIIGPVMVGPSSSHTAGAVRLGRIARSLLGEEPIEAILHLHGSFARTYQGHGTDKALIGGLLGLGTDDRRIRNSLELAGEKGLSYRLQCAQLGAVHPNTVLFELRGRSGKRLSVLGSSVGGGNILIRKINDLAVEFSGQYHTLVVAHEDVPGAVGSVTTMLGREGINIAQMKVYRSYRGGAAMMVVETDQDLSDPLLKMIEGLPLIKSTRVIAPV